MTEACGEGGVAHEAGRHLRRIGDPEITDPRMVRQ